MGSSYAVGMLVNIALIVFGVISVLWLSNQSYSDLENQSVVFRNFVALAFSQISIYLFWVGLSTEEKEKKIAFFILSFIILIISFLYAGDFATEQYNSFSIAIKSL